MLSDMDCGFWVVLRGARNWISGPCEFLSTQDILSFCDSVMHSIQPTSIISFYFFLLPQFGHQDVFCVGRWFTVGREKASI